MITGTLLFTRWKGRLVGTDEAGNRYYTEKTPAKGRRTKRWVLYNGEHEASRVPPEWDSWLHHTYDEIPGQDYQVPEIPWAKPREANPTGTLATYLPPGHDLRGGRRERSSADYEAWQP